MLYSSSELFVTTFGLRSSFTMYFYWCNGKASATRVVDMILFTSLELVEREKTLRVVVFPALLCIDKLITVHVWLFLRNLLQRLSSTMLNYFFLF